MLSPRHAVAVVLASIACALAPAIPAAAELHDDHSHQVPVESMRQAYADARISTTRVVVPMIFPVVGGASYTDTFLACRSGCTRKHFGQDLMGPKMRPLVATFNGYVSSIKRETTVGEGNYLTITGDNGWSVNYVHMNNDRPGTDDGQGTSYYAFAPGIQRGMRVVQGQLLGYLGDSGNAENTGAHLHFELRRGGPWDGVVYNAYPSLNAARRLAAAWPSGLHPDGALLRAGSGPVWLIDGGRRRVVTPAVMALNAWPASQVITVSGPELQSYRQGPVVAPRDGLVLRAPDSTLWGVADGVRHPIAATELATVGAKPDRVRTADAATLALLPLAASTAQPLTVLRPGALLRTPEGRVWYVDRGRMLRRIVDTYVLRSWGFAYADYTDVIPEVIDFALNPPVSTDGAITGTDTGSEPTQPAWTLGDPLVLRDGTVLRHPNGWMYVMSGGARRLVRDRRVWGVYGYGRVPVLSIPHVAVLRQPSGAEWPA